MEDDESNTNPSTKQRSIEQLDYETDEFLSEGSDSLADDESSGTDDDHDEEHPMTFNKDEIETLDRLLKDAEKYVG